MAAVSDSHQTTEAIVPRHKSSKRSGPEFYLISQFYGFLRPAAVRVVCNGGPEESLTPVVFRNKDNSMVQVFVNQTYESLHFRTVFGKKCFENTLVT